MGCWSTPFTTLRLELTPGFCLLVAALLYLDRDGVVPWALLAMACHELGHFLALKWWGKGVKELRLTAMGAEMLPVEGWRLSPGREAVCLLAGPAVNFGLALVSARLGNSLFAGLNLALGVFNLLPVCPLDGGQCLLLGLEQLFPWGWGTRMVEGLSRLLAVGLIAAGGMGALRGGGGLPMVWMGGWLLGRRGRYNQAF